MRARSFLISDHPVPGNRFWLFVQFYLPGKESAAGDNDQPRVFFQIAPVDCPADLEYVGRLDLSEPVAGDEVARRLCEVVMQKLIGLSGDGPEGLRRTVERALAHSGWAEAVDAAHDIWSAMQVLET